MKHRRNTLDIISCIAAAVSTVLIIFAFTIGAMYYGAQHPVTIAAFAIAMIGMVVSAITGGLFTWTTNC